MPKALGIQFKDSSAPWTVFEESDHPFSVRIGRGGQSEIRIPKSVSTSLLNTVSREHARLFRSRGKYWIEDLGSNNLTFVDEKVVLSPTRISLPCTLRLGKLELCLKQVSSSTASGEQPRGTFVPRPGASQSESITLGLSADYRGRMWDEVRERLHWAGALLEIAAIATHAKRSEDLATQVCECLARHLHAPRVQIRFAQSKQSLEQALTVMGLSARNAQTASKKLTSLSGELPLLRVELSQGNSVLWGVLDSPDAEDSISVVLASAVESAGSAEAAEQADAVVALSMRLAGPLYTSLSEVETLRAGTKDSVARDPSTAALEACRRAGILGESPQYRYCLYCAEQASRRYLKMISADGKLAALFILGETGTGKSALARLIHTLSDRARRPFHELNCAAIPDTLAESELFGYAKGAFAQAFADKAGFFEVADGGTLFLDEIGKTSVDFQSKLLKVLDTGEFTRLGSTAKRRTTCNVILAASEDPEKLIKKESFLAELWYRTGAFTIHLPPLRDRPGDTRLITQRLIEELNKAHAGAAPKHVSPKAMALLLAHTWPGNVRELTGCLRAAYALAPEDAREIDIDHLPKTFMKGLGASEATVRSLTGVADVRDTLDEALDQAEREYLVLMLLECEGNLAEVARRAQKAYQTIHTKMNAFRAWLAKAKTPSAQAEHERLRALAGEYWSIIEREPEDPPR